MGGSGHPAGWEYEATIDLEQGLIVYNMSLCELRIKTSRYK